MQARTKQTEKKQMECMSINVRFLQRTATACDSNKSASCERCRCSNMMLWLGCFFSKMRNPFDSAIMPFVAY